MAKRMVLMLIAMALLLGGIAAVKLRQIRMGAAQAASFQPPPEAVTTLVAGSEPWPHGVTTIGTVSAVQGVTASADLPGIVDRIDFESGQKVKKGDVLVTLDSRQEEAQLAAAQAERELTRLSRERMQKLAAEGVVAAAEDDRAAAEWKRAEARVGEIRATIERKRIRAPFAGVLGIRLVNRGQYLESGDPVVPLQSLHPVYVDFALPQQSVGQLRQGGEVRVVTEAPDRAELQGTITAIDPVVDPASRNVRVQATFANSDERLRSGMFVDVQVVQAAVETVSLPASAIRYAPFGDSVFVVADLTGPKGESYRGVRQQFVKLGSARGDRVAVLSGVKAGEEVVTAGAFKLSNGSAIVVHNDIQPGNDPAPSPENN